MMNLLIVLGSVALCLLTVIGVACLIWVGIANEQKLNKFLEELEDELRKQHENY